MKWSLKDSYNARVPASQRALDHSLRSHLEEEIELIHPASIVALGGAASDACAALSEKHGLLLTGRQGVDTDRLVHHVFRMATGREIPLHITRLPGKQNQRFGWTPVISHDIGVFLDCDRGLLHCEKVDRQVAPPHRSHAQLSRDREDRELLRRLKEAALWPVPETMSFEEVMTELDRREADRGQR
jgi:hypothetical protein